MIYSSHPSIYLSFYLSNHFIGTNKMVNSSTCNCTSLYSHTHTLILLSTHPHTHPPILLSTHPSIYLFIYSFIHPLFHPSTHPLSTHPSLYLSTYPTHPSIYPSITLFTHSSTHPSVTLSTQPSLYLSTYPSIQLFTIHLPVHPSLYPPTHLSIFYLPTSVFDKLIWCTIGPKSFFFGAAQFSLLASGTVNYDYIVSNSINS